jgi:hypothetical protein
MIHPSQITVVAFEKANLLHRDPVQRIRTSMVQPCRQSDHDTQRTDHSRVAQFK